MRSAQGGIFLFHRRDRAGCYLGATRTDHFWHELPGGLRKNRVTETVDFSATDTSVALRLQGIATDLGDPGVDNFAIEDVSASVPETLPAWPLLCVVAGLFGFHAYRSRNQRRAGLIR